MLLLSLIIVIVIGLIAAYLTQYALIDKYDIYFSKDIPHQRVTIIEKNIFFITIGYMYKNPETMTTLHFMLNYNRY